MAHAEVDDAIVDRVQRRVLDGMGLVVLHSGHYSKIFRRLMGTTLRPQVARGRASASASGSSTRRIRSPRASASRSSSSEEEMYGEHFDIPAPDELVLVSWFEGGEVFRSGCMLPARPRPDLLLPARPRDLSDLLRRRTSAG